MSISQLRDVEEESNATIRQLSINIIRIYSDRMPEAHLEKFFDYLRITMTTQNEEGVLSLLYGASKPILALFGF
jgi:hypothetical protein